jgi:hypothetical protein
LIPSIRRWCRRRWGSAGARTIAEAMRGMGLTSKPRTPHPAAQRRRHARRRVAGRSLMFCGHIDTVGVPA